MATEDRELQPGERIANYIVIGRASGGGHGSLYKVRHHRLEQSIFALKLLHASLRDNGELVRRMEREAQILSGFRHENIVRVFDAGTTEERDPATGASFARPYIAMDWLKGRSLAHVLNTVRHKGVGLQPALEIAIEVADALDHAHKHDVIHRDVKPENIFLQFAPGRPNHTLTKLLDFGVARALGARKITMRPSMVGTALYASPEQIRGEEPTPQTDLYAFGLVVYEMLVGRHPFERATAGGVVGSVLRAHLAEAPPPLSTEDVPSPIAQLVMRCLEKEPRLRPPSAAAVATELREFKFKAEAQRAQDLASLSKTDPSPVQNAITQAGGEATDPGPPPDMGQHGGEGRNETAPDAPAARRREEPESASRDTRKDGGAHVGNTLRMAVPDVAPTGVPSARTPVDRGALTHSEEPVALVAPPTGTDPIPLQQVGPAFGAPRIRVVGDRHVLVDDEPSPASPRPKSFCPPATGGTTSSAAAVAMFPRDTGPAPAPPGVRRGLLRLALVSVAVTVAVVSLALLTLSGRREPTPSGAQAQPVVSTGTLPAPPGVASVATAAVAPVAAAPTSTSPPGATTAAAPSVAPSSRPSSTTVGSTRQPKPHAVPAGRPSADDMGEFKSAFH
jgi:serine/threonine-protein kinase